MKAYLKIAALACVVSIVSIGTATAKIKRMDAVEQCMAKAHKEAPVKDGNDINTSANSKAITNIYANCMVQLGLRP